MRLAFNFAVLQRVWERVGGPRGFALVKVHDRALSGAADVTKCLSWVGPAAAGRTGPMHPEGICEAAF